jgi:hypothetical protein
MNLVEPHCENAQADDVANPELFRVIASLPTGVKLNALFSLSPTLLNTIHLVKVYLSGEQRGQLSPLKLHSNYFSFDITI